MKAKHNVRRPVSTIILFTSLALLGLLCFSLADAGPAAAAPQATTITVNSGSDPDTSQSATCISHTPCTLRRAIVQARNTAGDVVIAFDIPESAAEGWNSALDIWKINVNEITPISGSVFRRLTGNITIDGSTQPGGRSSGPKIIIHGPKTGQNDGLIVGDFAGHDHIVIRGLGFQNLTTHITINTDYNTIEDCWFGLSDDGTAMYMRGNNPDSGSGGTGVAVKIGANNNLIQNNVFLGISGMSAQLDGDHNTFTNNYVGTRADGNVPDLAPSQVCSPVDWQGGSGLSISDDDNIIENNIIAGLRLDVTPPSIQPDAIRVSGDNHIIRDNIIGEDVDGTQVGVCGRGIYLTSSTKYNLVTDNRIVSPGYSAISLNDSPTDIITFYGNTLRKNVIIKYTPWGDVEGQASPEDAIQVAENMPTAFKNFKPAAVTSIEGVLISGTAGANSPCNLCTIEIFLDDDDGINEAIQSLAVVTADANGNWTATLPAALTAGQGLRTTTTTYEYGDIAGMYAGTTTGLSELYVPGYEVFLPMISR